jgi:hypothetical protein
MLVYTKNFFLKRFCDVIDTYLAIRDFAAKILNRANFWDGLSIYGSLIPKNQSCHC